MLCLKQTWAIGSLHLKEKKLEGRGNIPVLGKQLIHSATKVSISWDRA